MAQRTVALCNGKYIGIETIYTVIAGKQINIPAQLKELRLKSRNDQLLCPCGCGAHLTLVAGDRNLREQHFRIRDGQENCIVLTEGRTSVESKIVLKCWLDDNLHAEDLESRVPICDVADTDRRYEYTFISRAYGVAVDYCYYRANLSDEKQSILEQNSPGIKIIHIVDSKNGGTEGQYPEGLMKIQTKQKYVLLLTAADMDYEAAEIAAVFYSQDIDGVWQETVFAEGPLKEYRIDPEGSLLFKGELVPALFDAAFQKYQSGLEAARARREAEKRRITERIKQQAEIEQRKKQAEEAEKLRRAEEEKLLAEKRRTEEDFQLDMELALAQQNTPVYDPEGNRWIRCEFCGKIATDAEFTTYGGAGRVNLGTCYECSENNPAVEKALEARFNKQRATEQSCTDVRINHKD